MKKLILITTLFLFTFISGFAGDLVSIRGEYAPFIIEGAEPEIIAKYTNINPQFSVSGITYTFSLYSIETSELIYSKDVEGEDVKPEDTVTVNFGLLETDLLMYNYLYRGVITTEEDFDENPSNNEESFEFEYRSKYYNLELKLSQYYTQNDDLNETTPAYVHDMAVGLGYELKSAFGEESLKLESNSYIGWIDMMPNAYYSHPTILFSYDIENDELTTINSNGYPNLTDDQTNVSFTNDKLIFGEEPEIPDGSTDIFIDNGKEQENKARVCALLVSGTDLKKKRVEDSFKRNVDLMKTALKNKLSNSGLTDKNIRVEHGISGEALYNILVSMVGKYDKVYFYYSGHMTKQGLMLMGKNMNQAGSGQGIIEAISDIGAKDNCIVWESCYSGLMEEEVAQDYLFEKSNVTIIASSAKDKQSFANYLKDKNTGELIGYGVFTFNFTKCYQDSLADKNKDKMVTLSEAYDWLKKNKPKDSQGRDIDSLLKFNKRTKSNGAKKGKNISFDETDLTITDENGSLSNEDNTVSMRIGSNSLSTSNSKISEISEGRLWTITSSAENGSFQVDLEVKLNDQYEMLTPMSPNIIGMVWREDDTEDWQPQYPSLYNMDNQTITCPSVDHFSDWAVGIISANPTSVDIKFLVNNVGYGPNPFKNMLNFEFNLEEPEVFSIEVVDITGKQMDFIDERQYNRGSFNVNLDGSKYISGTYYCRLVSANGIRTIKLVKE